MNGAAAGEYRLLSYRDEEAAKAGVLVGDRVYPATAVLSGTNLDASSVLSLVEDWPQAHGELAVAAGRVKPEQGTALEEVELLAPILYPRAIFCAGANYWDHVEEMEGKIDRADRPRDPWFFVKTAAHSIVADGDTVRAPAGSHQLDWEAELAVVIGRRSYQVDASDAAEVIAGFTILNDLSARDRMTRDDRPASMTFDWVGQKCFDGAAPMGPWFTPAAFVPDCHQLSVQLWVDGVLKQDSNTSQLVHNIFEQIEWLSHQLTLLPGDVIGTGTPSGVGMPSKEFLQPGAVVRIAIERCGELTNPVG